MDTLVHNTAIEPTTEVEDFEDYFGNYDEDVESVDLYIPPAPQMYIAGPLDDPKAWVEYAATEPPLSQAEIDQVQLEIDGIIGTTRDNNSIAKLVWSGDKRYWKQFHNKWDSEGRPIGDVYLRPHLLYKTIRDSVGVFVRDAFPPRWMIMTRLEPEQYVGTWVNDSRFFDPDVKKYVQIQPSEPPKEKFQWFMTIAQHVAPCCVEPAKHGVSCYGRYAHPRHAFDELTRIRRAMDLDKRPKYSPFDAPDRVSRRARDRQINNYEDQAMDEFHARRDQMIEDTPLALATTAQLHGSETIKQLRSTLREATKRDEDRLEQKLKDRRIK